MMSKSGVGGGSSGDDNLSVITTDESLNGTAATNGFDYPSATKQELSAEVRKLRRQLRKQERQLANSAALGTKSTLQLTNSTVWIILVIGILFCLADVAYIMTRIQELESIESGSTSSIASDDGERSGNSFSELIRSHKTKKAHGQKPKKKQEKMPWIQDNHKPDLHKDGDIGTQQLSQSEIKEMMNAKAPVVRLISSAGIEFDPFGDQDDAQLLSELPYWENITAIYGDKPTFYGVNEGNCETFQSLNDPGDHMVGTAGTFNTGTNLMAELLIANCHMPERQKKYGSKNVGVRWQVPWGKHTPPGDPEYREQHKTKKDKDVDAKDIMPIVTIRDPLVWLQSMCRHHYTAKWINPDPDHCPDFTDPDRSFVTNIKYSDFSRRHDSIVHHYNDYYNEYINEAKIPFLLVRFEDLVFFPEETTKVACECAGGAMRRDGKFKYVVDSAKKGVGAHGKVRTGYVDALLKYSTILRRYIGYNDAVDLEYIRDHLDPDLMHAMNYPFPDPEKAGISKDVK